MYEYVTFCGEEFVEAWCCWAYREKYCRTPNYLVERGKSGVVNRGGLGVYRKMLIYAQLFVENVGVEYDFLIYAQLSKINDVFCVYLGVRCKKIIYAQPRRRDTLSVGYLGVSEEKVCIHPTMPMTGPVLKETFRKKYIAYHTFMQNPFVKTTHMC